MAARRSLLATASAVATLLVIAPPAQAVNVTRGFDELAVGTTVTSQYAADGVTFGAGFSGPDGNVLKVAAPAAGLAQSAPNVLALSVCNSAVEFPDCTTEAWLRLDRPQTTMSFRTGLIRTNNTTTTVQVTSYTASQTEIDTVDVAAGQGAKTLVTLDKRANAFPCGGGNPTCNDGLPGISYVKITASPTPHNAIGLDDITIDKGLPPAPPEFGVTRTDAPPGTKVVLPGNTTKTLTFRIGRTGGSSGNIAFSLAGLPAGVSGTFEPANTTGGDGTAVALKLTATNEVKPADATVTVTATPAGAGVGSGPRTLTFPLRVQGVYDLVALSLLPTQSVVTSPLATMPAPGADRAYAGTPLVAGKRTVVLVHARATGVDVPLTGVTATLTGTTAGGAALPGSPLKAEAAPVGVGDKALAAVLTNPEAPFTFTLPPAWTTSGPINLRTQVAKDDGIVLADDPRTEVQCAACTGNEGLGITTIPFLATQPVNITPVQITWQRPAGVGKVAVGDPGAAEAALSATRATLPVSDANYLLAPYAAILDASTIARLPRNDDKDGNDLNADGGDVKNEATYNLLFNWEYDQLADSKKFFELGSKLLGNTVTLGITTTIARGLQSGYRIKRNGVSAIKPLAVVVPARPLTSVAHELGHALGRDHADRQRPAKNAKTAPTATGCGGGTDDTGAGADQGWPDPFGKLDKGGMAVDIRPGSGGSPGRYRLLRADKTFDFMSYCASTGGDPDSWISDRGWRQALRGARTYPGTAADPGAVAAARSAGAAPRQAAPPVVRPVTAAGKGAAIEVSGFLAPDGTLQFSSVGPAEGARLPNQPGSPFKGQLTDASGRVVSSAPLSVTMAHNDPGPGQPGTPAVFVRGTIPTKGAVVGTVVVRRAGKAVGRRSRSRGRPTVRVPTPKPKRGAATFTIRWTARDRDTKRLQAKVQVSRDGGRRYATIYQGPSRARITVPTRLVPAAAKARIRVRVSDGFNLTSASTKIFRSFGAPPSVRATAASRVLPGARVYAAASAFDDRSRPIADRSVAWFTGGQLVARGRQVSIGGLARGRHRLTVVAVDGRGRATRRTVRVTVSPRR